MVNKEERIQFADDIVIYNIGKWENDQKKIEKSNKDSE